MNPAEPKALTHIALPDLPLVREGKVRSVYDLGDHYLFVATDRISAFDCILPNGIPWKGTVLNQLSAWWFDRLGEDVPHHMVTADIDAFPERLAPHRELLDGRSMIVKKLDMLPVECVARGYLAGSAWKEYRRDGRVSGIALRSGYQLAERLDEPIFTPARKATSGHDENIDFSTLAEGVGSDMATRLKEVTLALFGHAAEYAARRGILIADTKFEFGLLDGELTLADEALTPDSSRYWPKETYSTGVSPPSYDKQFVRDYLEGLAWDKTPPAPALPPEITRKTAEKYMEAYQALTGRPLPGSCNSSSPVLP